MDIWTHLASEFQGRPTLDEILFNGSSTSFWVEGGELKPVSAYFQNDKEMQRILQDLAFSEGLRLDPLSPACGGMIERLGIVFRWHTLLPPLTRDGPLLSLRRQRLSELQLKDFACLDFWNQLTELWRRPRPTFIIGSTGAGKTSLLIALLQYFSSSERVAILEQVPEIPRLSDRWIRLAARGLDVQGRGHFALEQVFDELLRLRPDTVAIGELRQDEAKALHRALLAGIGPVWCTLHADSPQAVCDRLAELSAKSPAHWQEILKRQEAIILVMQREKPRLSEAWVFTGEGLKALTFSTREKTPKEFS